MPIDTIPAELIARLKARAADPERRSGTASLAANSTSLESLIGRLPPNPDPQVQNPVAQLQGLLANAMSVLGKVAGERGPTFAMCGPGVGGVGGGIMSLGGTPEPADSLPCSEGDLAATEAELGFALPEPLRQLYLEVGDGHFGPGRGLYSRAALVAKYREMTETPAGPNEEEWPANLLPINGDDWDLVSIDRDSGRLVAFDVEEIEEEEPGSWDKAFKPAADSLAAWLEQWLGEPTPAEQYQQWDAQLRRSRG